MKTLVRYIVIAAALVAGYSLNAATNAVPATQGSNPLIPGGGSPWTPVLILIVPAIIKFIRKQFTKLPAGTLPWLAPVIGAVGDTLLNYASGTPANPLVGAAMGMAGTGLREMAHQVNKTIQEGEKVGTLCLAGLFGLFGLSGCSTLQPGEDALVVNVERTMKVALPTFNGLLEWEHQNRDKAPDFVKKAAKTIRSEGKETLLMLDRVKTGYQDNIMGRERLTQVLNSLTLLLNEARVWTKASTASGASGGDVVAALIADAEAHDAMSKQISTQSLAGVLGIIGLVQQHVLPPVLEAWKARKIDRAMTPQENAAFRAHMLQVFDQPHWKN